MKVDTEKTRKYLNKIEASRCPLCGNAQWSVSDTIFQAIEFDTDGLHHGGSASYPMVPITCNNCGNTYFINALVAGLIDNDGNSGGRNDGKSESETK